MCPAFHFRSNLSLQFFGSSSGRGGFGGGFGSGFGGAGGRSRAQQGEDEKYELKLDFLDAVFGAKYAPRSIVSSLSIKHFTA